jgi:hypothetical protein
MRQQGWQVLHIAHEMMLHDAQMTHVHQWWTRMVRGGHAYAEGMARHWRQGGRYQWREVSSIVGWAAVLPCVAGSLAWYTHGLSLCLLGAYGILWYRVKGYRLRQGDPSRLVRLYANFCILGKFPQLVGILRYGWSRLLRCPSHVIEHSSASSRVPQKDEI